MEDRKTIFSYIGQLFATYGIIVSIFMIFSVTIGDMAKEHSTLFELGKQGLTVATLFQLIVLALIITVAQILFLTDKLIKSMNVIARNVCFFGCIVAAMVVFAICFDWFPINEVRAWVGFGVSFVICTALSITISKLEERTENQKMEQALAKLQNEK